MSRKVDLWLESQSRKQGKQATQLALDEAAARNILDDLFPRQRQFVTDPYRRKTLLCPRRAGKTHSCIAHAVWTALLNPKSTVKIITLSLGNAKKYYWGPISDFSDKYKLNLDFKIGEHTVYFPNGSQINLMGVNDLAASEKVRGDGYSLVIIDECKSFRDHVLMDLVFESAIPATNDVNGSVVMVGTPGEYLSGLFYEATCPAFIDEDGDFKTIDFYEPEPFWEDAPIREGMRLVPGWRRHHWNVQHNTFTPDTWKNALELKASQKWADDNPVWLREYLGQWVATADTMVYKIADLITRDGGPDKCRATWLPAWGTHAKNKHGLPLRTDGIDDWSYVLGMDLGFEDASAFVVMAHSETNPVLYQVYEHKEGHLTVEHVAGKIAQIVKLFDDKIDHMVSDGQGKQLVESINQMYGYYIVAAEKSRKFDHIELLNSDLEAGRLRVFMHGELYKEWMKLQWTFGGKNREAAIRLGRIKEDPKVDNHLSDAALYTWRFCLHHFTTPVVVTPEPDTPEFYEEWDDLEYQAAVQAQLKKQAVQPFDTVAEPWTDNLFGRPNPFKKYY